MIPIPPVATAFLKKWWPALIVTIGLIALLLTAYCEGRSAGRQKEIGAQQEREIETQIDLGKAGESAADRRVNDAVEITRQEKELQDALNATTDPDRQRILRGCIILRQQGRDVSDISACR